VNNYVSIIRKWLSSKSKNEINIFQAKINSIPEIVEMLKIEDDDKNIFNQSIQKLFNSIGDERQDFLFLNEDYIMFFYHFYLNMYGSDNIKSIQFMWEAISNSHFELPINNYINKEQKPYINSIDRLLNEINDENSSEEDDFNKNLEDDNEEDDFDGLKLNLEDGDDNNGLDLNLEDGNDNNGLDLNLEDENEDGDLNPILLNGLKLNLDEVEDLNKILLNGMNFNRVGEEMKKEYYEKRKKLKEKV